MKLTGRVLLVGMALAILCAGCGRRASYLREDPRARRDIDRYGKAEAVARAEDLANQVKSADAYTLLAHIYALAGNPKLARETLNKALQVDPTFPAAALLLAELNLQDRKPAEALKLTQQVLKAHPEPIEAYEVQSRAQLSLRQFDQCEQTVRDGLKQANSPTLHWVLADVQTEQGKTDEAKKSFERAIRAGSEMADVRLGYAQLLLKVGDKEEAAKQARKAAELAPNNAALRYLVGTDLYEAGYLDEAVAQYREALVLDPNHPAAANNLALILADRQQDTSAAVAWARKAAVLAPRSAAVADTLGWALARDGQYQDGLRILQVAYKALPDNPAVKLHYGWTLAKTGKKAEGVALIRQAAQAPRPDLKPIVDEALKELGG